MTLKELTSCLKSYDGSSKVILADGREINSINITTFIGKNEENEVVSETKIALSAE